MLFPTLLRTSVASSGYFASMRFRRSSSRCFISAASTALSAAASAVFCIVFVRASFAAFVRSVCQLSAFACWYIVLLLRWYLFAKSPYDAPPIYSALIAFQSARVFSAIVNHSLLSQTPNDFSLSVAQLPFRRGSAFSGSAFSGLLC